MRKLTNVRAHAAKCLLAVMDKGNSLSDVLPKAQQEVAEKDGALLQEICFGAIRNFAMYDGITSSLLTKKLKGKQRLFHHLIIVGLYQLDKMRVPEHAAVAETVQAAVELKAQGLKGLINACLRNFQRNKETLINTNKNLVTEYNHPSWYIKRIQAAYPDQWQIILKENNERAPMWLRIHTSNVEIDKFTSALDSLKIEYTQPFADKTSVLLARPYSVTDLPGFEQGWFAVQDGAAQQSGRLLNPQNGELVLDACSAPGGKACHVLDLADCNLVAADIDSTRLERVEENLERLQLNATLIEGDLTSPETLKDYQEFDRILLDAPCSATGVIRRHPDIKWLRRNEDIEALADVQKQILANLWPKLKVGGQMLYATCSVLPEENKLQMAQFLATHKDAKLLDIQGVEEQDIANQSAENPGWQILPNDNNMDGFYYCLIEKQE